LLSWEKNASKHGIRQALAVALKSNRALRTLFLGNNEIGDEGIKALRGLP
jgi:Ran GTPase-activating protein (RanGAP) involved in mRNA processing and transport